MLADHIDLADLRSAVEQVQVDLPEIFQGNPSGRLVDQGGGATGDSGEDQVAFARLRQDAHQLIRCLDAAGIRDGMAGLENLDMGETAFFSVFYNDGAGFDALPEDFVQSLCDGKGTLSCAHDVNMIHAVPGNRQTAHADTGIITGDQPADRLIGDHPADSGFRNFQRVGSELMIAIGNDALIVGK